jgi:RNA polymerase primary sigma factor
MKDLDKFLVAKSDEELVSIIAEEYADSGLSKDELVKAGMDGIAKAREHYDETKGFSFNAYAVWWVRQRIIQDINEKEE